MEKTIKLLNDMEASAVVQRYAIGGAMGAVFYSEAVLTEDLDVFVLVAADGGTLLSLSPIYEFLKQRGAKERHEHLLIEGVLVQILPAYDVLTEEAVRKAVAHPYANESVKVMRVEHLLAIALKTGRPKDHARIAILLEEADIDHVLLEDILHRHELTTSWTRYKQTHE